MVQIYALERHDARFESAVQLFWRQWGTETNFTFYYDCMLHSNASKHALPSFYIALEQDEIIGTYALLRNDLVSRQDIFPWLACLYVAPKHRGRSIGGLLLKHAREEASMKRYDKLYLCTDLSGYYEKYGWRRIASAYSLSGEETSIYEAAAGTDREKL